MKKEQANNNNKWFVLLAILILIYLFYPVTVHQNEEYNNKLESEVESSSTNNSVYILPNPNDEISVRRENSSIFYRSMSNDRYHYEFRSEFNSTTQNGEHRLMIILNGAGRSCSDMWEFSVGTRILKAVHHHGYSALVICSQRKTFNVDLPIETNNDAKYIYLSLQRWIHEEYYTRFHRYPLLYIHGTARGSKFAGILCRILPIQAQTLHIYPGHREAMLKLSAHDTDLQTRLSLDSTFANWFYFAFCYNKTTNTLKDRKFCPFHNGRRYYNPVPPTFFTILQNDPSKNEASYINFVKEISSNSLQLGGPLFNRTGTLQIEILPPAKPSPAFMQENFRTWHQKPYASQLFFEHFTNQEKYSTTDLHRKTCWCLNVDLKYFENFPNVTATWSREKQDEYKSYISDIQKYLKEFSEEVCGDLTATYAMVSRNVNQSLDWMKQMDQLRRSLNINNYLKRPLRKCIHGEQGFECKFTQQEHSSRQN